MASMRSSTVHNSHRAFVMTELVTVVAVVGVMAALLFLASADHRRRAHGVGSVANLQKFAAGITSFASDNEDRVASFSWRAGETYEDGGITYHPAATDLQAAANQAVAIIRRRAGRPDIPLISTWIPHILYSHLALIEHLDQPLPADFAVSPADQPRLAWQAASRNQAPNDNGAAFFALSNRPGAGINDPTLKRWAFSSSYEFGPAFFAPDARVAPAGPETISQSSGGSHNQYYTPAGNISLGQRRLSEIAYPGNKAMVYETHSSDMGANRVFFAFPQARSTVLLADGSASIRTMQHTNRGFQPNLPLSPMSTQVRYNPELSWEPAAVGDLVHGVIRWTRSGLRGRDFGGPEVPWVD